jgi:hypothetical protein
MTVKKFLQMLLVICIGVLLEHIAAHFTGFEPPTSWGGSLYSGLEFASGYFCCLVIRGEL